MSASPSAVRVRTPILVVIAFLVVGVSAAWSPAGATAAAAGSRAASTATSTAAVASSDPGPGPILQTTSSMVTADALPTTQIDGVAWKQVVVGNRVYVGGNFGTARPAGAAPGVDTTPRTDLLAYDITTGQLINSFQPTLDGQVLNLAVSPDGTRLYAVGDFLTVNGKKHERIAAFDAVTGALIGSFTASLNNTARAVVATDTAVYVGGRFAQANGVDRTRLAAFTSAGVLTAWAPTADYTVNDMVLAAGGRQVDIGGAFLLINGAPVYGIGAVSATTGASMPFAANQTVQAYGTGAAILSLSVHGSAVYGTAYTYKTHTANLEGTFSANSTSGAINWVEDCHGDTYGSFVTNGAVYTVSHAHYCQPLGGWPFYSQPHYRHTVAFTIKAAGTLLHDTTGYPDHGGEPAPSMFDWFPDMEIGTFTGQNQAAWAVSGNSNYIVEGGEFPSVNGVAQQGLVRFTTRPTAPGLQGPMDHGAKLNPEVTTRTAHSVRLAFRADWDRDDKRLTYQLVRDSHTDSPIWTGTVASEWWNRPMIGFTDTGLAPGVSHTYRVYVSDADGNTAVSDKVTVAAAASTTLSAYDRQVVADGASHYWPLDESTGTVAHDYAGADSLDEGTGVGQAVSGPIAQETAAHYSGDATGLAVDRAPTKALSTLTVSAWVRTTSTSGGKIVGFGNNPEGLSSTLDRHLYIGDDGTAHFGVTGTGINAVVSSPDPVNDGHWHQLVGTLGQGSITLTLDGNVVARRTDVTPVTPAYSGWWRIGGDNLTGWPFAPTSDYLQGDIGSVAVFPKALALSVIQNEYRVSGRALAAFTPRVKAQTVTFDASASSAAGQHVSAYAWNFGDGTTATGSAPTHKFASIHTYVVTLKVTDSHGLKGVVRRRVLPWTSGTIVSDGFDRSASDGLGSADLGGAWTTSADLGGWNVQNSAAIGTLANAGAQLGADVGPSSTGCDVLTEFSLDKVPAGGNFAATLVARRVSRGNAYLASVLIGPGGAVSIGLYKQVGGVLRAVGAPVAVPDLTYSANVPLYARVRAFGTAPTTLRARVWRGNRTEPKTWQVAATDAEPALQHAGTTGLRFSVQSTLTPRPH